ncbi:unnamed protein product [Linum tenue]|uniref:Uncharacterized protein n=1 Tax=Linum tenue TaxID=586396 RepID=A0AAV0K071_9ROSI|nr:unnamed protein product [Linum tenue]CAI0416607.1 unnamed protein product [Linum tenue]
MELQLNWLNHQLDKIWPYVDAAASELIRNNVEPILEEYRPAILSSLKFSKLTLGTVAPQFTGSGVTMELEMQWDGNPNIVLDINTRVGVALPIQVKDIGFTGVFRLIFKPLKQLDFRLKVIGGELSSIPGLSDAIEEGILDVKLVQAKELSNKDVIGKSDPFAVVFIRPLRDRTKTSKVINNQLNPVWNEHFEFVVEDASTQHLTIRVFDDEGISAAELIGCAQVALKDLEPGKVKDVWLKLVKDLNIQRDNKYRGEVHLELLYIPYGMDSSLKNPFNPDYQLTTLEKKIKCGNEAGEDPILASAASRKNVIVRGVLSVNVVAAEDLPAVDVMGKADPYVVLIMKKSDARAKTRVVQESLNPVWNQTFDFVVEDALHEMLILEVWDHDTFGKDKIGRVIMTLTRVIMEGEFQDSFPVDGAKSGKLFLHLKWTPQLKFRDP